jgi:N-formylglutamate amidohydrolase
VWSFPWFTMATPGWLIDRFGPKVTDWPPRGDLPDLAEILDRPGAPTGPLLVHVPHAGTFIPRHLRDDLLLDDAGLQDELDAMTDWHTDRLALTAMERAGASGTVFRNRLSRLVIDPERFPDDREVMLSRGMGAVYTKTSTLAPLRRRPEHVDPSPHPRPEPRGFEDLLSTYFEPYASALRHAVQWILLAFERCVLVDLHSYPSAPLPYELDPSAHRPGVCIGTDPFHTPEALRSAVADAFSGVTGGVAVDTPFAGTYVPLGQYRSAANLTSVMVEIRRDLYLDEPSTIDPAGFDDVADRLASLLRSLAATPS